MKKTFLLLIINFFFCSTNYSQNINSSKIDVFNAKLLTFYGFDYSRLKLADENRETQIVKPFFVSLTNFLEKKFGYKKMQGMLRKDSVTYKTEWVKMTNEKISNKGIVTAEPQYVPADSLSTIIKNYAIDEKEGIGYSVIFECFDKKSKTVAAYMVFFDISTKKVIYYCHAKTRTGNGYNHLSDWKAACIETMLDLFDNYNKDKKEYLKSLKVK